MNAREALDVLFDDESFPTIAEEKEAIAVLREFVEAATAMQALLPREFYSAVERLRRALSGEQQPPVMHPVIPPPGGQQRPTLAWAATAACRTTTVPCGFASCEVHYGRST